MNDSVMFLDCPAYMDKTGAVRCGLPAEVEGRYTMSSTDGPMESARIRCPRGHWFNGPIESLALPARQDTWNKRQDTWNKRQDTWNRTEAVNRLKGASLRRPAP